MRYTGNINSRRAKMTRLTVSSKWLVSLADQLDRDADQSLHAWIILGQSERYSDTKARARILRRASEIRNIGERREYLRNNGVTA